MKRLRSAMHNNFYYLRQLSVELGNKLKDSVMSECFSQNKDELILRFETRSKPFFIKASLLSDFCCLSFPSDFNRARKNSIDLFGELIGQKVIGSRQYENERCFSLLFSDHYILLFKLHGNRANLLLYHQDKVISLFRNHLTTDHEIQLDQLDKTIDFSKEAFVSNHNRLKQLYFTFGKIAWQYLNQHNFKASSIDEQWKQIQGLRQKLETPTFYIIQLEDQLVFSLVALGKIQQQFTNPLIALHEFFTQYSIHYGFEHEKQRVLTKLRTQLKNDEAYLTKTSAKLKEIEADDHYKTWADLLMANLHTVKMGMDKIVLPDFYHENKPIEIKLKKELNAQKNAEVFYRKSKNHHIEIQKLKEALAKKETECTTLHQYMKEIAQTESLKELRKFMDSLGLTAIAVKKQVPLPYHETEYNGFKIWVGKNAKQNDELTLHYTYKEDLWLHAKDVAGSHVVVKYQSGKKFPKDVVERAAQLAAFNSKRKTDSLCPVIYTPKKFVRKRKGDPSGSVVVEKEEVTLVEPKA